MWGIVKITGSVLLVLAFVGLATLWIGGAELLDAIGEWWSDGEQR